MRSLLLVPLLLALLAPATSGQRLPAPFATVQDQPSPVPQSLPTAGPPRSPGRVIIGGSLGGVAGLLGGALVGAAAQGDCSCEDPYLVGAVYGGVIGETAGVALGTHLGDGSRGDLAADLVASTVGAALGLLMASGANSVLALIPAAAFQVVLVAGMELDVARRRAGRQ